MKFIVLNLTKQEIKVRKNLQHHVKKIDAQAKI